MSKPVLFVSFRPLRRAENIRAAYDAYDGPKVHMMQQNPDFHSEVLSGKYDVMVTDDLPTVTPGKCIMIWHGIQGGKTIGLDQPGRPYYFASQADMITYIVSASTGMVDTWSKCTGVPKERIVPLGMPRTDEYKTILQHRKQHPNVSTNKKRTYLFVPTFRDVRETPFPDIDWQYIDDNLLDNEVLIVKIHPWNASYGAEDVIGRLRGIHTKHIKIVDGNEPTAPYLYDADVVITDYSSIMFDAYLLDIPVVLFEKTPGYIQTRGMYFEYPSAYCSFCAWDEYMLLEMLRYRATFPCLTDTEERITHTVAGMCDGHACERLNDLIYRINK